MQKEKLMTEELWNELGNCMDKYSVTPVPTGKFSDLRYDVNPYSPTYEPLIKQAVQYKRAGNYDEAIKIYIKIFDDAKCFNTEIVRYLCKVLICDGELLFAFHWLGAAGIALEKKCGPCPDPNVPFIPWAQFQDATELINACIDLRNTRDIKSFCNYVASIAGNPGYVPANPTDLVMQADEIVRIIKS